jgi:hypothetical protein
MSTPHTTKGPTVKLPIRRRRPEAIPTTQLPDLQAEARYFGDPNMAAALHYASQGGGSLVEAERAQFDAIARADTASRFQRGRHRRNAHRFDNTWWVVIAFAVVLGAAAIAVVVR